MNTPSSADMSLADVRFSYGETLMRFNAKIPSGTLAAIIGPSGSGKTTLLNLIAGFETPDSGSISIGGKDIIRLAPAQRPVSMVFQENNLFAHLTVEQNVGIGRVPNLKLTEDDRAEVAQALVRVGLAGKEQRKPEALSGGERQRVAIARALVRHKPILLLDEAFASLGPALRLQMLDLIKQLHKETGMSVLMVTHSPEDALYLDTFLLFILNGRITEMGAARDLLSPTGPDAIKNYIGERPFRPA
ncbi:thiamine ABC transporter ATP-binding protein [Falsochrobactrum ovis]|uniref:Thiamine transport system ATP-binding protein n=1 Tax=Falsochrobactrum ovis TaxID=1293442 RepID=A0A364JVW0_9HYPH|nr:thiamine ABC transporter ATP-binding protein [Falsochrobactrum ovis]RAK30034.1 thiamine transport system ATP-binding protein [Falsochrobactrum ovis]